MSEATLKERVAKVEVGLINVCDAVNTIRSNDLVHLDAKIDKMDDKISALDKKVGENAVRIGVVFAVLTTAGQTLVSHFLK